MGVDLSKVEAKLASELCNNSELLGLFHGRFAVMAQFFKKHPDVLRISSEDSRTVCSSDTYESDHRVFGVVPESRYELADSWKEEYGPEFYCEFTSFLPGDAIIQTSTLDAKKNTCVFLVMVKAAKIYSSFVVWIYGNSVSVEEDSDKIEWIVSKTAADLVYKELRS